MEGLMHSLAKAISFSDPISCESQTHWKLIIIIIIIKALYTYIGIYFSAKFKNTFSYETNTALCTNFH